MARDYKSTVRYGLKEKTALERIRELRAPYLEDPSNDSVFWREALNHYAAWLPINSGKLKGKKVKRKDPCR